MKRIGNDYHAGYETIPTGLLPAKTVKNTMILCINFKDHIFSTANQKASTLSPTPTRYGSMNKYKTGALCESDIRKTGAPYDAPVFLFLCFFEDHVLAELLAELLEFNLAFNQLLILASPIGLAGLLILDLYEFIL